MQKKTLGKQDIRLLEVLGFEEVLKILNEEKEKQLSKESLINQKAGLEGFIHQTGQRDKDSDDDAGYDFVGLGGINGVSSKTKT